MSGGGEGSRRSEGKCGREQCRKTTEGNPRFHIRYL